MFLASVGDTRFRAVSCTYIQMSPKPDKTGRATLENERRGDLNSLGGEAGNHSAMTF